MKGAWWCGRQNGRSRTRHARPRPVRGQTRTGAKTRGFQRVGDTRERRFQGKIVAATNRNLAVELQAGRFRTDLYYRLCADMIETPSLQALLADAPQELPELLRFIAARVAGDAEADALAAEVDAWITKHLGRDYPWPGNIRELEQCVRNVMVRGEYRPPAAGAVPALSPGEELAAALEAGTLTAEELLRRYCTLVFSRTGSYQETARRLGIDRRTVKDKVDPGVLAQLRPQPPSGSAFSGSRDNSRSPLG
jgi:DNA-binding NtrC family response regulator